MLTDPNILAIIQQDTDLLNAFKDFLLEEIKVETETKHAQLAAIRAAMIKSLPAEEGVDNFAKETTPYRDQF